MISYLTFHRLVFQFLWCIKIQNQTQSLDQFCDYNRLITFRILVFQFFRCIKIQNENQMLDDWLITFRILVFQFHRCTSNRACWKSDCTRWPGPSVLSENFSSCWKAETIFDFIIEKTEYFSQYERWDTKTVLYKKKCNCHLTEKLRDFCFW